MQHAAANIHAVDGTGEGGEDKDSIKEVGSDWDTGFDNSDNVNRVSRDGLSAAVDERVVHGDDKGGSKHSQGIEDNYSEGDFACGHLHGFGISENSGF